MACLSPVGGGGNLEPSFSTLRKRMHALRTFWDLRWHVENRAVAAQSDDPQISACSNMSQLVPSTCSLRLPRLNARQDRRPPRPNNCHQPPHPGPDVGSGPEVPDTPHHSQPTCTYGRPLVRTMGPSRYRVTAPRYCPLYPQTS